MTNQAARKALVNKADAKGYQYAAKEAFVDVAGWLAQGNVAKAIETQLYARKYAKKAQHHLTQLVGA